MSSRRSPVCLRPKPGLQNADLFFIVVHYSWINRQARAERYEVKGYWCYETGKAATCMAERPPHALIRVREGLRAGGVVGDGRVEEGGGVRGT